MAGALTSLGAAVDTSGPDWRVTPGPLTGGVEVDCGLAGTVTRFVPPVAGLADGPVAFDGDPHMRTRPVGEVLDALRALGVAVRGRPAAVHRPRRRVGARRAGHPRRVGVRQFVSALLLAGARFDEGVDVLHDGKPVPSQPHLDMTVAVLREHGVEVDDSERQPLAGLPGRGPRRRPHHRARPVQRRAVRGAGRRRPAAG